MATMADAEAARDRVKSYLDHPDDVSSVGVVRGPRGDYGVRVSLRSGRSARSVPDEIEGVPVTTRVGGRVTSYSLAAG
jgi:hypothetical protein